MRKLLGTTVAALLTCSAAVHAQETYKVGSSVGLSGYIAF
ncbi:MAG: hypothetical protein JWL84_2888, partial [Rhodospirillales bacterium]|nr:hypothetical protein [Rhodospirillales bacterium]